MAETKEKGNGNSSSDDDDGNTKECSNLRDYSPNKPDNQLETKVQLNLSKKKKNHKSTKTNRKRWAQEKLEKRLAANWLSDFSTSDEEDFQIEPKSDSGRETMETDKENGIFARPLSLFSWHTSASGSELDDPIKNTCPDCDEKLRYPRVVQIEKPMCLHKEKCYICGYAYLTTVDTYTKVV